MVIKSLRSLLASIVILSSTLSAMEQIDSKSAESLDKQNTAHIEIKTIDGSQDKAFVIQAIRQEHELLIGRYAGFDSNEDFDRMLMDVNSILFVGKKKAGIISYNRRGHLYLLYIAPDFRGKGYGKLLVDFAKASLKERGIEVMTLEVFDYNHSGKNFFNKLGFQNKKNNGNLLTFCRVI